MVELNVSNGQLHGINVMSDVAIFSQRDPRWAADKHGASSSTIGATGCTISALASILVHYGYAENPRSVNQKLTLNNGYAAPKDYPTQKNLIIWTAIPKLWPRIKIVTRYYLYNNEIVKNNLPCLVEVSGERLGAPGGKHWVSFVGGGQMMDPWYGNLKTTSYYGTPTGFTVITGEKVSSTPQPMPENYYKGIDLSNTESVKVCVDVWADVRDGKYVPKAEIDGKNAVIEQLKTDLNGFMESLATKLNMIVDRAEILGAVDRLVSRESELETELKHKQDEWVRKEATLEDEIKVLEETVASLRKEFDSVRLQHEQEIIALEKKFNKTLAEIKKKNELKKEIKAESKNFLDKLFKILGVK